jgi:hypothetical protein
MKTLNFNFSPFFAFIIGVLIAIACVILLDGCGETAPPPQPIIWDAVNDSSENAPNDSLYALDSLPQPANNIATQMKIEGNFDKIN